MIPFANIVIKKKGGGRQSDDFLNEKKRILSTHIITIVSQLKKVCHKLEHLKVPDDVQV